MGHNRWRGDPICNAIFYGIGRLAADNRQKNKENQNANGGPCHPIDKTFECFFLDRNIHLTVLVISHVPHLRIPRLIWS